VSLILEALRKLEREKQTPARGVVVLGGVAAPGSRPQVRPLLLFLLGLCLGGAVLAAVLWRPAAPPPPPASAALTIRPATTPTPVPPEPSPRLVAAAPPTERPPAAPAPAAASPSPSAAASQPFTLQAVSERDGRPVAIINDRLLREGDSIDGARIVKIAADQVELEIDGRRVVLRF
jgi:hypothetical protein